MPDDSIAAVFGRCKELLRDGEISALWKIISDRNFAIATAKSNSSHKAYVYYVLACGLYGFSNEDKLRALNQRVNPRLWAPLRYRLALRMKDFTTAKQIRAASGVSPAERSDFRCSLGLHLLWNGKIGTGFHFYESRHSAINFSKTMPDGLRPYAARTAKDFEDVVILEQGVGEILLCLRHLKDHNVSPRIFIGQGRYRALVETHFPSARFLMPATASEELSGRVGVGAMDILRLSWEKQKSFKPTSLLGVPALHSRIDTLIGICWRGGSAQNRREERRLNLHHFLDLLPIGPKYVPMQFDMTAEEEEALRRDSRIKMTNVSLRGDVLRLLDAVSGLSGMISVDSANIHLAAAVGIPACVIMNHKSHWFWGRAGKVEVTYPSACTVKKSDLGTTQLLNNWVDSCTCSPKSDVRIGSRATPAARDTPLFMACLPRSGSSLAMEIIQRHGVWLGHTMKENIDNPRGFFENVGLKRRFIKAILVDIGHDPNGVRSFPRLEDLPLDDTFRGRILAEIERQGYNGADRWAFKDPKLTLLWPLYARAFPDAHWLVPKRSRSAVLDSLARVNFMKNVSADREYLDVFLSCYEQRLGKLEESGLNVMAYDADAFLAGDTASLAEVLKAAGINPRADHFDFPKRPLLK